MKREEAMENLDARGRRCSMLSMMVGGKMGPLPPGTILEVITDDPGAPTEIPSWCQRMKHELISLEPQGEEFRIRIRRGG